VASRAVSSTIRLDELLATIARAAREALDTAEAAIDTYDPANDSITIAAYVPRDPEPGWEQHVGRTYRLIDFPVDREMLLGGEIVEELVSDPVLDERNRQWTIENGEKAFLNVPLIFGDQPFGIMVLVETEVERRWSDEAVVLARALGEQAAVAIEHARLHRRVQNQAITDGLTGLFNHRYFYERLEQEIARPDGTARRCRC